jgi:SAM-dependent methyltransferase
MSIMAYRSDGHAGNVRAVTDAPSLGRGTLLDFMAPLSAERADRLVHDLVAAQPGTVADLGCGWGELLLRILGQLPVAHGIGVDSHAPDLERGREAAAQRGIAERVTFVDGEAASVETPADLVISIGAYQAFGSIPTALAELRRRVNPGGRLLFGAEFWDRVPDEARLANMWPGMTVSDCLELADLVDAATAVGFRPLYIDAATGAEWHEFESLLAADNEQWLLAHPQHPEAEALRDRLDRQRNIWLRGHRGYLGFAYLMLGAPV